MGTKCCKKCRREIPPHEFYHCVGCKLLCCRSCLVPLEWVGQSDRCRECDAVRRAEEYARRVPNRPPGLEGGG